MIEKYKFSIYDCHENGARKIKTKIKNFIEQTCDLELHVDDILAVHLSNKWFHPSKTKCQKTLEIERSFYISLTCKTRAHNKQKEI
jgi:t-SNARE complex subunit (syntaxin)